MHVGEGEVSIHRSFSALCSRLHSAASTASLNGGGQRAAMGEHSCALCAGRCAAALCMLTPSPTGGTRGGELSIRVAAPRTRAAFNYTFSVFCRATALSTWVDGQQIIYYSCALTRLHFYVLYIRVPHLKALHFCECCLCLAT